MPLCNEDSHVTGHALGEMCGLYRNGTCPGAGRGPRPDTGKPKVPCGRRVQLQAGPPASRSQLPRQSHVEHDHVRCSSYSYTRYALLHDSRSGQLTLDSVISASAALAPPPTAVRGPGRRGGFDGSSAFARLPPPGVPPLFRAHAPRALPPRRFAPLRTARSGPRRASAPPIRALTPPRARRLLAQPRSRLGGRVEEPPRPLAEVDAQERVEGLGPRPAVLPAEEGVEVGGEGLAVAVGLAVVRRVGRVIE